jgi:hypothetical protein
MFFAYLIFQSFILAAPLPAAAPATVASSFIEMMARKKGVQNAPRMLAYRQAVHSRRAVARAASAIRYRAAAAKFAPPAKVADAAAGLLKS